MKGKSASFAIEMSNDREREPSILHQSGSRSSRRRLTPNYDRVSKDSVEYDPVQLELESESILSKPPRSLIHVQCWGKLLLGWYGLAGMGVLSMIISGQILSELKEIMLAAVLLLVIITTLLGIFALIQIGTINDHIERIEMENQQYSANIDDLKASRGDIASTNDKLKSEVIQMQQHEEELKEQAKQFSDLNDALEKIAQESGMEFGQLLDQTNARFGRMESLIYQNHKTYFLTLFYRDNRKLDEDGYQRLLWRMDRKFREGFKKLGPFHSLCDPDKDYIDLIRFEEIVEEVLEDPKEVLQSEFVRQYTQSIRTKSVRIEYMTEMEKKALIREVQQDI